MVKPGLAYLDIIRDLHDTTNVPLAVYQSVGNMHMQSCSEKGGWITKR